MFESNKECVNEDTVQCYFFSSTNVIEKSCWEETLQKVNKTIQSLTKDYIWHQDEFKVHLPITLQNDMPPHLMSSTCFGDNLEDEWFIVHLAIAISEEYEDLVVQIKDNDGEFLLIEAAEVLPKWANPDSTENRVFIYKNQIHLIPLTVVDTESTLTIQEAIKIVTNSEIDTSRSDIQQVILKRIGNYPEKIFDNIHKAIVKVPIDIAILLKLQPSLISSIVNMYCSHDMIDAKTCKNLKFDNCVLTEITFTKCLYAMLIHSKMIKNNKYAILNEHDKKSVLGIKLAFGYQMIINTNSSDIYSSKAYMEFHKKLVESGYFKENIEGSKDYMELLKKSREFFSNVDYPITSKVCSDMNKLLNSAEFVQMKESIYKTSPDDLVGDNEDWLDINPDQLNDLLDSRYGQKTRFKNDDVINAQTVTSNLSNFFKQTSDYEGIEQSDRDGGADNLLDFNPDEFAESLKHMLNLISNRVAENSDDDSYFTDIYDDENSYFTDINDDVDEDEVDRELRSKLHTDVTDANSKSIMENMIQSMKEEVGSSGPSSNILRSIGINKRELLDSDDDEDES